jgi:hypothetical protein
VAIQDNACAQQLVVHHFILHHFYQAYHFIPTVSKLFFCIVSVKKDFTFFQFKYLKQNLEFKCEVEAAVGLK